jgi:hypothetical protein
MLMSLMVSGGHLILLVSVAHWYEKVSDDEDVEELQPGQPEKPIEEEVPVDQSDRLGPEVDVTGGELS